MSITELDLNIREIANTYDTITLQGIRARLIGLVERGSLSMGIYRGLNKDIRDRSDWLRNRSR